MIRSRSIFLWLSCILAALLAVVASASAAPGEGRPEGLLWNRTGLPLVFPLVVKSDAGRDYYMRLVPVETGEPALAAYVRGGVPFRVLVPPGTFDIRFAAGTDWQGEELLFGVNKTQLFSLPEPLTFEVLNRNTKGGHAIDLRGVSEGKPPQITVEARNTCQGYVVAARLGVPKRRSERPDIDDAVGQDVLERRFKRGLDVFETYDRTRQQKDFDPPVLGLPVVPLARPEAPAASSTATLSGNGSLLEWPC